jgi:hypothetical protein
MLRQRKKKSMSVNRKGAGRNNKEGCAGSEDKNEADIRTVEPFSETPVDNHQAIR